MKIKYLKSKIGITPNYYVMVRVKAHCVSEKLVITIISIKPGDGSKLSADMKKLVGKSYPNRRLANASVRDVLTTEYLRAMKTMPGHNPTDIQRLGLDVLKSITKGTINLVDPTSPFVFLMETPNVGKH